MRHLVRQMLERAGYWSTHRSVLPFGIDPIADMQRVATSRGIEIERIFDVGAHVGQTAREYLAAFPRAEVHSFEPHPNSFRCLAKIDSPRFRPHQLALSDRCGLAEFFVFDDVLDPDAAIAASMNNSLVQDTQFSMVGRRYEKSIQVDCATVDAVCDREAIERLTVLKIDTEGHEAAVLHGARDTLLRRDVRFVYLEFETLLPVVGAVGGALAPCAARLEPLGFRLLGTYPVNMIQQPFYAAFNALFFAPG